MLNIKKLLTKILGALSGTVKTRTISASATTVTVPGQNITSIRFDCGLTGYATAGIVAYDMKNQFITIVSVLNQGTYMNVWVRNNSTAAATISPTITALYCKNDIWGGTVKAVFSRLSAILCRSLKGAM